MAAAIFSWAGGGVAGAGERGGVGDDGPGGGGGAPVRARLGGPGERGAGVRLIRENVVIHEGKLSQLKRFKDDVNTVASGIECGMAFENYQDMRAGDTIECYRVETIARSL